MCRPVSTGAIIKFFQQYFYVDESDTHNNTTELTIPAVCPENKYPLRQQKWNVYPEWRNAVNTALRLKLP